MIYSGDSLTKQREVESFPACTEAYTILEIWETVSDNGTVVFINYIIRHTIRTAYVGIFNITGLRIIVKLLRRIPYFVVVFEDTDRFITIERFVWKPFTTNQAICNIVCTILRQCISRAVEVNISIIAQPFKESVTNIAVIAQRNLDTFIHHFPVINIWSIKSQKCISLCLTKVIIRSFLVPVECHVETVEERQVSTEVTDSCRLPFQVLITDSCLCNP